MTEPKYRLKTARENAGYKSPSDAARKIAKINVNTLISNENGNRPISKKMAQVYADAFDVSAGWIIYGEQSPVERKPIPLISWVSAGALMQPDYVSDELDAIKYFYLHDLDPSGDWIALRVSGRSMDMISPEDSVLFVNRNERSLVPNGLYIIGDGEGGITFKRYRPPNILEPVSSKDEFKVIYFDQEPDVIGRVRRTVLDL